MPELKSLATKSYTAFTGGVIMLFSNINLLKNKFHNNLMKGVFTMKTYFMVCIGILVLLVQFSFAQVPENITHQGVIKDSNGELLSGDYNIAAKLYDQETSGTMLWQETHSNVTVTDGVFNIRLGEVNPLILDFDQQYWLGISIDGGTELSPRLPLSSVPYSMRAKVAESLEGDLTISQEIIGSDSTVTGQRIDLKVINNVQTAPITGLDVDISAQGGSVVAAKVKGITVDVATLQRTISFEDTIVGLEIDLSQVDGNNPTKIAATMTGGKVGIGTKNPQADLDVKGTVSIFGEWEEREKNIVYYAETDGFVTARGYSSSPSNIGGWSDENNPPITRRVTCNTPGDGRGGGITMPVKKGHYWKVTGSLIQAVYWLPLGINFD
jgi:hypothetical protein